MNISVFPFDSTLIIFLKIRVPSGQHTLALLLLWTLRPSRCVAMPVSTLAYTLRAVWRVPPSEVCGPHPPPLVTVTDVNTAGRPGSSRPSPAWFLGSAVKSYF